MIVRFSTPRTGKGPGADPSFILGKTYLVFGIHTQPGGRLMMIKIRRESDGLAVLVELHWFTVIDPTIPPGWCFVDHGNGYQTVEPNELSGDFWSRYHGDYSEEACAENLCVSCAKPLT